MVETAAGTDPGRIDRRVGYVDRRHFLQSCLMGGALLGAASASRAASLQLAKLDTADPVRDYLTKIRNYNHHFADDVVLTGPAYRLLLSTTKRLRRLQSTVGHANFSLISFDYALRFARNYSRVGRFTPEEIAFLEEIFYTDASKYGFYGEKVSTRLTERIARKDTVKIPRTGQYLFRGDSERLYHKIRKDIGDSITLTSGVRGVVKQMYLFLNKAVASKGNLSMASRSLAPPGHSFHGIGDFDVGKKGFGYRNFTEDFAETAEFHRLEDLGYISIRYHPVNPFGVRFEPWHIKVV